MLFDFYPVQPSELVQEVVVCGGRTRSMSDFHAGES